MSPDREDLIRVVLVDDHKVVREGLRAFLSTEAGIEVIGEASNGRQAIDRLDELDREGRRPDVVVMDLMMEEMDGVQATRELHARFADIGVLVLTSFVEEERVHAAMEAGASGYLLKDADVDEVAGAIRSAHRGEVHIDPAVAKRLLTSLREPAPTQRLNPFDRPLPPSARLLPRTKFNPPPTSVEHVGRSRLLEALASTDAPVLMLSAPAGFGKSTLLGQWVSGLEDVSAVWVGLDPEDNGPGDFWSAVLAGLAAHVDGEFDELRSIAGRLGGRAVRSEVLIPLISILDDLGVPFMLMLDDLHAITDPDALASLDWFLGNRPPSLRLVISTHAEPQLPSLSSMRARGELFDLRSQDLALRPEETKAFLTERFGGRVGSTDFDELERRIDGWPAALFLVTLALQRGDTAAEVLERLAGGDSLARDLAREVLRTQTPEVQSFLLRTSIFERFSAELCEEVLDDPKAVRVLRRMAASNLLVVALDHRHSWFRYHPLLRDLLRAQLERADPVAWRALHLRAGRWFQQRGEVREAMVHYLSGEHWNEAAEFLAAHYGEVGPMSGRVRAWLSAIPDQVRQSDARLCLVAALHDAARGDRDGVEMWLWRGSRAGWEGPMPDGSPSFEAAGLMLRTLFSFDDLGQAADYAAQLAELQTEPSQALTLQEAAASVTLYGLGRFDEAEAHALASHRYGLADPDAPATMFAPAVRAMIALRRGDRASARPLIAEASAAREALGLSAAPISLLVLCAQARYLTDSGRASEAVELCEQALQLDQATVRVASSAIVFLPSAVIELAYARAANGDVAGAREALEQARELVRDAADAGAIPGWIDELDGSLGDERPVVGVQPRRDRDDLSQRELEILRMLAGNMTIRELANELFISHNTIKTHLRALYRKLGVSSREEAVVRARELGLLRGRVSAG